MSLAAFFIKGDDGKVYDKDDHFIDNEGKIVRIEWGVIVGTAESPDKGWNPIEEFPEEYQKEFQNSSSI